MKPFLIFRPAIGCLILALAGCATVYNAGEVDRVPRPPADGVRAYRKMLSDRGITGEALIRLEIGEDGSIRQMERIHEEAGPVADAVMPLVRDWRFTPALKGGQPVACSLTMEFTSPLYSRSDPYAALGKKYRAMLGDRAFTTKDVDSLPMPISRAPPAVPAEFRFRRENARAIVGFIVAADGHVRDATILESTDAEWGELAVATVSRWVFRPAMKDGGPVPMSMIMPVEVNFRDR